jgi:DNA-binding GntR family transcriptional regulator
MADLYDLESVLEVHALGVAIITPKLLAQLRVSMSQTQRYLKDGDTKQLIEESHRFRRPIMAATGNLELCRAMESIEYRSFLGTITSYDLLATIAPETHTKVYKALRDGNRAHAQGAVRERLACLRVHLLNAVPTKGETAREGSKPIAGVSPPNSNNRKHPRQ